MIKKVCKLEKEINLSKNNISTIQNSDDEFKKINSENCNEKNKKFSENSKFNQEEEKKIDSSNLKNEINSENLLKFGNKDKYEEIKERISINNDSDSKRNKNDIDEIQSRNINFNNNEKFTENRLNQYASINSRNIIQSNLKNSLKNMDKKIEEKLSKKLEEKKRNRNSSILEQCLGKKNIRNSDVEEDAEEIFIRNMEMKVKLQMNQIKNILNTFEEKRYEDVEKVLNEQKIEEEELEINISMHNKEKNILDKKRKSRSLSAKSRKVFN